jgi:hypothetical protein
MFVRLSDMAVQRGRSRWEHTGERQVGECLMAGLPTCPDRRSPRGPGVAGRAFSQPFRRAPPLPSAQRRLSARDWLTAWAEPPAIARAPLTGSSPPKRSFAWLKVIGSRLLLIPRTRVAHLTPRFLIVRWRSHCDVRERARRDRRKYAFS